MLLLSAAAPAQNAPAPGDAPLTERESVRMGLARPDFALVGEAALTAARSDADEAGRWANPVFEFQRESMPGVARSSTERTVLLSQQFDVSGRRGLRRDAAGERLAATQADLEQRRARIAGEIRQRHYEALYRQGLVNAAEAWERRMAVIAATVEKLHQGGEVTGYDRRRMLLEQNTAQTRVRAEQAQYRKAHERLAALIGAEAAQIAPAGELAPADPPALELLLERVASRPELRALERRASAFELEHKAAQRGWIPDVTLGLGQKSTDSGSGRETGNIVSFSLPVPLFDRGQASQQRAFAQAGAAHSEGRLQRARLEGEVRALWQEVRELNAAARAHRELSASAARELARIAEAAYRGGEGGVLELLDAYRAELEADNRALELGWNARQAAIELNSIAGNEQP